MKTKAFTLVELMIVIAIIGILAAALFPSLTGYLARSRDTRRVADIQKIAGTLMVYHTDHGYMKRTLTYGGADVGAWDYSSQPTNNPDFLKYLSDEGYGKVPKDPINNTTCDMQTGNSSCNGFAYFYYCYLKGENAGSILYDQYVLGARIEQPAGSGSSPQNGKIGGLDNTIYYFGKWNEGTTNATTCN